MEKSSLQAEKSGVGETTQWLDVCTGPAEDPSWVPSIYVRRLTTVCRRTCAPRVPALVYTQPEMQFKKKINLKPKKIFALAHS